eukprot:2701605-Amphidinium_carterae.1
MTYRGKRCAVHSRDSELQSICTACIDLHVEGTRKVQTSELTCRKRLQAASSRKIVKEGRLSMQDNDTIDIKNTKYKQMKGKLSCGMHSRDSVAQQIPCQHSFALQLSSQHYCPDCSACLESSPTPSSHQNIQTCKV